MLQDLFLPVAQRTVNFPAEEIGGGKPVEIGQYQLREIVGGQPHRIAIDQLLIRDA